MSFFEIDSRFLIDTAFHRLEIIRDDGLYRHLRMQQPGTSCYYYDVITWPGYLTVTGDMGTWTFSRIADMFDFFGAWEGGINTHYWAEKLEAGAGCSAREMLAKEYDHDAFCKSLKESLSDYLGATKARSQKKMTTGTTMTTHPIATKQWCAKSSAACAGRVSTMNGRLIRLFMMLIGQLAGALGMSAKD
ncbi:hypothetical protein [Klebsiella pneumoniae]|uniref:hypothetical protein n=1 Tax=Klebsiella pneumoniae TaxID=573 RepID=UPI003EBF027A